MPDVIPFDRSLSEFKYANNVLTRMIDNWVPVEEDEKLNRQLRYTRDMSSHELRIDGIIPPSDIFAPVRVIDTNIRREQPQYVNYLTQSQRSLVFVDPTGSVHQNIISAGETDFTRKARYLGWEKPFIRVIDGCQEHGWDAVEVIFDDNYPGHFAVEHIGHADLIFPTDCEDLQSQEIVARRVRLTSYNLNKFVTEFDFNEAEVNKLINRSKKGTQELEDTIQTVYKIFYKEKNCVYVAWYAKESGDWLKSPAKLFLGRRDVSKPKELIATTPEGLPVEDYPILEESSYPLFILPYVESEDPKITCLKGRADQDKAIQESASAMQSSLVNGCIKASQPMATPRNNNINSTPQAAPKLTDVVFKPGGIYDQPMDFFHTPWPEAALISAFQAIISQNQNEQSQVNFAVLNRKDSNKTATEVQQANQKAQELSSIQIILLSIFIRSVYSLGWSIYQNRVLQQKLNVSPDLVNFFVDELGAAREYVLRSSGDVDVIERDAKLNKFLNAWGVFQNTPIAQAMLEDIIRLMFPDEAERYIKIMQQQISSQQAAVIGKQAQVIKLLSTDENGNLSPVAQASQAELQALDQEAQASLSGLGQPPQQVVG